MEDIDFNIDYYNILGINKDASSKVIKKAYYKLARETHPDASGSKDGTNFKKIKDAYDILIDENKRNIYDSSKMNRQREFGHRTFSNFAFNSSPIDELFNTSANGIFHDVFQQSAFDTQFSNIFTNSQEKKPKIIKIIMDVTLEDIYNNITKNIKIKKYEPCKFCEGNGIDKVKYSKSNNNYTCAKCLGKGYVTMIQTAHHSQITIPISCTYCKGRRILIRPEIQCDNCKGDGKKMITKKINYTLSHETKHKSLINIPNQGHHFHMKEIPGDIVIMINQINHPDFRRSKDGKDLLMIKKISLYFSLGCHKSRTIQIKTISKNILKINIDDNVVIKPGSVLKIPNSNSHYSFAGGNLYIIFEIIFPDIITEDRLLAIQVILKEDMKKLNKEHKMDNNEKKITNITNYNALESVKISEIYSSFPINSKISNNDIEDDEIPEYNTEQCIVM